MRAFRSCSPARHQFGSNKLKEKKKKRQTSPTEILKNSFISHKPKINMPQKYKNNMTVGTAKSEPPKLLSLARVVRINFFQNTGN